MKAVHIQTREQVDSYLVANEEGRARGMAGLLWLTGGGVQPGLRLSYPNVASIRIAQRLGLVVERPLWFSSGARTSDGDNYGGGQPPCRPRA